MLICVNKKFFCIELNRVDAKQIHNEKFKSDMQMFGMYECITNNKNETFYVIYY